MHVIDLDREKQHAPRLYALRVFARPSAPASGRRQAFHSQEHALLELEKIRGIMGRDFKDAETIANIQMTFHVLRIQNRFDKLILRKETE